MGFGRDLGAALSFGLAATTKQKDAEKKYDARQTRHREEIAVYKARQERCKVALEDMDAHFTAATAVLLSTGTLATDSEDNVIYGWYQPNNEETDVDITQDLKGSAIAAIPAFSLMVGTPALVWTSIGLFGTASTGVAISSLSGAAASAATAAWLGRAVTLGLGGGMTAGRVALGPIGLAASLLTLPIGAAIAGNRERRFIQDADLAEEDMTILERIYTKSGNSMEELRPRMAVVSANLQRHTGVLEIAEPESDNARKAAQLLEKDLGEAIAIRKALVEIVEKRDRLLENYGFTNQNVENGENMENP